MSEREDAQAEADVANAATSSALNRPHIVVVETGKDVTEDIVSVLEALVGALMSGSGWLDDEQERAVDRLTGLLRFPCDVPVYQQVKRWYGINHVLTGKCGLTYGHDAEHQVLEDADPPADPDDLPAVRS